VGFEVGVGSVIDKFLWTLGARRALERFNLDLKG
jgi:hypothetical protein